MLLLVERDQDLTIRRTDRGSVTQSKIQIHRQTNVSEHKVNLVLWDYASDHILYLRKNMLRLALVQILLSVCFYLARSFADFKRPGPRPKFPERWLLLWLVV
jgi:hypothetical protein